MKYTFNIQLRIEVGQHFQVDNPTNPLAIHVGHHSVQMDCALPLCLVVYLLIKYRPPTIKFVFFRRAKLQWLWPSPFLMLGSWYSRSKSFLSFQCNNNNNLFFLLSTNDTIYVKWGFIYLQQLFIPQILWLELKLTNYCYDFKSSLFCDKINLFILRLENLCFGQQLIHVQTIVIY